ncbi:MAG TPA: trypsin-like peptidase domain-containing protein [Candidatus Saccharimonadales bacterium]
MADTNTSKNMSEEAPEHSVSSSRTPRGRNISFTLPSMPRVGWRNIAGRTKALGLAGMLAVGLLGGFAGAAIQESTSDSLFTATIGDEKKIVTSESELISSIAKNVGPSVVSVNVSVANEDAAAYRRFFGYRDGEVPTQQAAGTGVIISKDGLVLTNRHVVPSGTTKVSITLSDGTELEDVEVLGRTNDNDSLDIAVLKITDAKGHKLPAATLGDSSKVAVGDEVVAIGNALGQFQNTVTSGIISGFGRSIVAGSEDTADTENLENLFQTDAAINQGNSGGPLVNLNGQVIGINTAVASDSQNIGFAIPINDVKGIIERVVATGKLERPYLGVRYVSLTADLAKEYELKVDSGAYIAPAPEGTETVLSDGPAAKAGLKTGDIITKVNGEVVNKDRSLTSLLSKYQPGDRVKLTVVHDNDTRSVTVTLGVMPN